MNKKNIILALILVAFIVIPRFFMDRGNEKAVQEKRDATYNIKNETTTTPPVAPPQQEELVDETGPLKYSSGIKATEVYVPEPDFTVETVLDTSNHKVLYYPSAQNYHILVTDKPFNAARDRAEKDFLETMNITRQQACDLNVVVNTVPWANPLEAGMNYPLSFCEHLIETAAN